MSALQKIWNIVCLIFLLGGIAHCAGTQDKQDTLSENGGLFIPNSVQIIKANFAKFPADYTPQNPRHLVFEESAFHLNVFAEDFSPAKVIYIELTPKDAHLNKIENLMLYIDKKKKKLYKGSGVWYTLYSNNPSTKKSHNLLRIEIKGNTLLYFEYRITLKKAKFPIAKSKLNVGDFSNTGKKITPEIEKFIELSREKKKQGFLTGKKEYLSWNLSHPRDLHKITSPFYIRREYERFKVKKGKTIKLSPAKSTHRGLDLKGLTGAPIYAIADGRVTLADFLYYEGGIVMIDHGSGVLSGYMHQSEILVKAGDIVQAGQQIGKTGATGMVTGPHLHIFLYVHSVLSDPLSFLSLPIKVAPQYADLSALSIESKGK